MVELRKKQITLCCCFCLLITNAW